MISFAPAIWQVPGIYSRPHGRFSNQKKVRLQFVIPSLHVEYACRLARTGSPTKAELMEILQATYFIKTYETPKKWAICTDSLSALARLKNIDESQPHARITYAVLNGLTHGGYWKKTSSDTIVCAGTCWHSRQRISGLVGKIGP